MRYFVILLCLINMLSCTDDPENESEVQCPLPTTQQYAQLILNDECIDYNTFTFSTSNNFTFLAIDRPISNGLEESFKLVFNHRLTGDSTYDISSNLSMEILDFDSFFGDAFLPTVGKENKLIVSKIGADNSYIEGELLGHLTKNKIDPFFTGSYPDSLVISSGRFRILNSD